MHTCSKYHPRKRIRCPTEGWYAVYNDQTQLICALQDLYMIISFPTSCHTVHMQVTYVPCNWYVLVAAFHRAKPNVTWVAQNHLQKSFAAPIFCIGCRPLTAVIFALIFGIHSHERDPCRSHGPPSHDPMVLLVEHLPWALNPGVCHESAGHPQPPEVDSDRARVAVVLRRILRKKLMFCSWVWCSGWLV